jgi:hypothetical protein
MRVLCAVANENLGLSADGGIHWLPHSGARIALQSAASSSSPHPVQIRLVLSNCSCIVTASPRLAADRRRCFCVNIEHGLQTSPQPACSLPLFSGSVYVNPLHALCMRYTAIGGDFRATSLTCSLRHVAAAACLQPLYQCPIAHSACFNTL